MGRKEPRERKPRASFIERYGYLKQDEIPNAKFVRLAKQRLVKTLKAMRGLQNLGVGNYVYTQEQSNYIVTTLQTAIANIEKSFLPREARKEITAEIPA